MPHPLRTARPDDPYLRFRLEEEQVVDHVIDVDHIAFVRPGRRPGELWITALGDDPDRIRALIEELLQGRQIDGIHVEDAVYLQLPEHLRIPDPGHWSIWVINARHAPPGLQGAVSGTVDLDPHDTRIDPLLEHSDSAYLRAGDPSVRRWVGVVEGGRLLAVGAETVIAETVPHLVSICTDPSVRGRGYGRRVTAALVQAAFACGAPEVYLEMYAGNAAAAAVYRGVGFREAGRYRSGWLPDRAGSTDAEPA